MIKDFGKITPEDNTHKMWVLFISVFQSYLMTLTDLLFTYSNYVKSVLFVLPTDFLVFLLLNSTFLLDVYLYLQIEYQSIYGNWCLFPPTCEQNFLDDSI